MLHNLRLTCQALWNENSSFSFLQKWGKKSTCTTPALPSKNFCSFSLSHFFFLLPDLMSHALNVLFVSPCGLDLIPPGACKSLNSSVIYANNEVNLAEVDIYGFDYDYTLAQYSNALNTLIYNTARDFLVEHFKVCLTSRIKYGGFVKLFSLMFCSLCFTVPWRNQEIRLSSQLCRPWSSLWHSKGAWIYPQKWSNVDLITFF